MKYFYLILFIFFGITINTNAQSTLIVEGQVLLEGEVPLQNVSVKILNSRYQKLTNAEGRFSFSEVPSGVYTLNFQKEGFAEINEIIVLNNENVNLSVNLTTNYQNLAEVTVTSQKREELIQRIPVSITSLSFKAIEESQIQNLNDLTAIAPNLYASDPGDRRSVTSIRGIATTSYDPAIATYIDGVNQFNLDTNIPQLFDIERIEVLRGPQGTLYGRNALGGVINIITRKPQNTTSIFAEATLGSYGLQQYLAGTRSPLIKDRLFFGAAGLFESSDGFYINEFNNSKYDKSSSFSGNYYLKYLINDKWDATLNFKHIEHRNNGAFPLVVGIEEAFDNPFRLNQNQVTRMVDNTLNSSLVIEHRGENFNFTSQSSYQKNYRFYEEGLDADFSPLDAILIYNNYGPHWNKVEVGTQEFKFSSPASLEDQLKWTTGLFLFYQKSPVKQAVSFGEDAGLLGIEDTNFSLINSTKTKGGGIAIFGQAEYPLTKKIDLIAGLRYDLERKEQFVMGEYQRDEDLSPSIKFQQDTAASANFSAFSPKVGITYKFTNENLGFLTYSRGFRAGGLTPLSSDPTQVPLYIYDPEFSDNYELGFKNWFFYRKLLINFTFFYNRVSDVQVPTLVLPDAVTIIENTGELLSKGAELEVKALLFKGFEFSYDLGIINAEYKALNIAREGEEENLKGRRQIFTPAATSLAAFQYSRPLSNRNNSMVFLRGEWKYLGKQYFDLANQLQQDPYSLFNAQVGIEFQNWKFTVWGRNVLDKKFISYAYDFGAVHLGNPATYGVTLRYKI